MDGQKKMLGRHGESSVVCEGGDSSLDLCLQSLLAFDLTLAQDCSVGRDKSLLRTTKAKSVSSLCANHWCQYWTPKDPEAQHAAELDPRVHILHEQDPGEHMRAPRQEGVQSGCWQCRYQLDGNMLACANSAEAACQESSPQFHVSQVDCVWPNGCGNRCFPEPSQKGS